MSFDEEDLAFVGRIDDYMELLYEPDIEEVVRGSLLIRRLCSKDRKLHLIASHHSLLGALSRVLKDQGRKSIKLCLNIIYVFYSLSTRSEFHKRILGYNIDRVVLLRIRFENRRFETFMADRNLSSKRREQFLHLQAKLLTECLYCLINLFEYVQKDEHLVQSCVRILHRDSALRRHESDELIGASLRLLQRMFLAPEFTASGFDIVDMFDALLLLLKSRVVRIVSDREVDHRDRLAAVRLVQIGIQFLSNFVHEESVRQHFLDAIPLLLRCVDVQPLQTPAVVVLYHVSKDPESVPIFRKNRAPSICSELCVEGIEDEMVSREIVAWGVNLAIECAAGFIPMLNSLLTRLFRFPEALFAKLVRTISETEEVRSSFRVVAGPIVKFLARDDARRLPGVLVELLGLLGNVSSVEAVDFVPFYTQEEYNLARSLNRFLRSEEQQDDVLLEALILLGKSLARTNGTVALVVSKTKIVEKISQIFLEKHEDEEILCQCLYTFQTLFGFKPTSRLLLEQPSVIGMIIGLVDHENVVISRVVDTLLDVIQEIDSTYREKIVQKRFERHNTEWCALVAQESSEADSPPPPTQVPSFVRFGEIDPEELDPYDDDELGASLDSFSAISDWNDEEGFS